MVRSKHKYDWKPLLIKWIDELGKESKRLIDGCQYATIVEMAIKDSNGRAIELWARGKVWKNDDDYLKELLFSRPSAKQLSQLDAMMDDIVEDAKVLVEGMRDAKED